MRTEMRTYTRPFIRSLLFSFTIIVGQLAMLKPAIAAESTTQSAPVFSLPGESGLQISLQDFQGKVVLVDFWASWCAPCIRSFPWMNSMLEKYGQDGFAVIAINMDQEPELAKKFLQKQNSALTIAFDPKGVVARQYQVMGLPNSFLIDRQGLIAYRHVGFRLKQLDDYENEIKTLLADK